MSRLRGIMLGKCPVCEQQDVFKKSGFFSLKMPEMQQSCSHCGHVFEKESGYFWGAMYMSYALTVMEVIAIVILSQPFFEEKVANAVIWMSVAAVILLSKLNYKFSRILWMYLFTPKGQPG